MRAAKPNTQPKKKKGGRVEEETRGKGRTLLQKKLKRPQSGVKLEKISEVQLSKGGKQIANLPEYQESAKSMKRSTRKGAESSDLN